jgi:hypothetical protein
LTAKVVGNLHVFGFVQVPVYRLIEDGWKEKKPSWTSERLEQIVTPLLVSES